MKQHDLYYLEAIQIRSQALSKFGDITRLRLVFFIQNLTRRSVKKIVKEASFLEACCSKKGSYGDYSPTKAEA